MVFDPRTFAATEWRAVLASKTFKALLAIEAAAVVGFVDGLIDGSIPLTKRSVVLFLGTQAAAAVVLLLRHTLAGIELKIGGAVDPATVKAIEAGAEARALSLLSKTHPDAAAVLRDELAKPSTETLN